MVPIARRESLAGDVGPVLAMSMQGGSRMSRQHQGIFETDFTRTSRNSTCPRWSCMVRTTKSCDQYFRKEIAKSSRELRNFLPRLADASPHECRSSQRRLAEIVKSVKQARKQPNPYDSAACILFYESITSIFRADLFDLSLGPDARYAGERVFAISSACYRRRRIRAS